MELGTSLKYQISEIYFSDKEDCIRYSNEELLSIVHIENLETAKRVSDICADTTS